VCGIIFMLFAAPRLLPGLANPICQLRDGEHRKYLAELKIHAESNFVGLHPLEVSSGKYEDLEVIELIIHEEIYQPRRDWKTIEPESILLVKGSLNDLVALLHEEGVELPYRENGLSLGAQKDAPIVVELLIAPGSSLHGSRLHNTRLGNDKDINIIAVKRQGHHLGERKLYNLRLKTGDILLIWCSSSKLDALRSERDYLIIEDVYEEIVHKRKAVWAVINFIGMIGTASLGLADIMTCALIAAFLMIVTGCLQMRDAYRSMQGDVLLLIAGTIALGIAMEKSGASTIYADAFLGLFHGLPPMAVLGGIIVLTSISTQLLSNNATAVLLLPVAISTALGIGVDPKPFIIGVCFGASACFASPLGYQTNLMVFVPGGYRFIDYLRLGIPLNLFIVGAGMTLIPLFWPF
jgi:di/tricarboxylate transporter